MYIMNTMTPNRHNDILSPGIISVVKTSIIHVLSSVITAQQEEGQDSFPERLFQTQIYPQCLSSGKFLRLVIWQKCTQLSRQTGAQLTRKYL